MKYVDEKTREISFPLGGIGTGCIGLGGNGRLQDWEIFNRPGKGRYNGYSHLAVRAVDDKGLLSAKILNGDLLTEYTGSRSGFGFGAEQSTMAGFPHFRRWEFDGQFPMAVLTFRDDDFPGAVRLTAFNPFIPLDSKNSSIPAACFEVTFHNPTAAPLTYTAAFSVCNPFGSSRNAYVGGAFSAILLEEPGSENALAVACDGGDVHYQENWYRGAWYDGITTYWNDFTTPGKLKNRHYDEAGRGDTCTLCADTLLAPGESQTVRFVLTWSIPYAYNYWNPYKDDSGRDVTWKNYYATVFESAYASAAYLFSRYETLRAQTVRFRDELFGSSLPACVKEAVSANLAVLKSPTVLRLEDGSFYGWEGVHSDSGSCEGTCQHVWNYAYAACFLFPDLERSIKELEFRYSTDENGRMQFRLQLPLGRERTQNRACLDGQMGTVIKCWREWKLSGDGAWLRRTWPDIKRVLEYAWHPANEDKWDADCDGVLEGRQHHTLDAELFGPSSWLEGFYLAALKAAAEMADYLEDAPAAEQYRSLFEQGRRWTEKNLFNGSYYIQQIDLKDKAAVAAFGADTYWNEETQEIKYQIGEGCEIDQLCAQWHANIIGLGDIFDKDNRLIALKTMYANNFKHSMRKQANTWRLFSLNDEAGAVMCDYPEGARKPAIPVPYCEETMHGFEYAFAGLLISEGLVEEGLAIVQSVRDRYDGKKRNPWNEIECGSNYARSMASFALLPLMSGFLFDMPAHTIGFRPVGEGGAAFRCPWFTGTAWGAVSLNTDVLRMDIHGGELTLCCLKLPVSRTAGTLRIDGAPVDFTAGDGVLYWEKTTITNELTVTFV